MFNFNTITNSNVYGNEIENQYIEIHNGEPDKVAPKSPEGSGQLLEKALSGLRVENLIQQYNPNDIVTVIVELYGEPLINTASFRQGVSDGPIRINGVATDNSSVRHEMVKSTIMQEMSQQYNGPEDGIMSISPITSSVPVFDVLYDYYVIFDGFAVRMEYQYYKLLSGIDSVKRAFIENVYTVPETQTSVDQYMNADYLKMVGVDMSNYTGDGIVIAIIDSGLDTDHEAFQGDVPNPAFTKEYIAEKLQFNNMNTSKRTDPTADEVYISEKIPFVYDYADNDTIVKPSSEALDHGTHVSGIASANSGDYVRGVAPDAQLIMMKAFSDFDGSGYDSNILAAVEDAAILGVDVLNMSLGFNGGFSTDADDFYNEVYQRITDAGVVLCNSAGNNFSTALLNQSGEDLPFVTDPDTGIIGSPSSYTGSFSVASVDNASASTYLKSVDGKEIIYRRSDAKASQFSSLDGTYDYVVCGVGRVNEISAALAEAGISGSDKWIALMQRGGDVSFELKVDNAFAAGASAAVVYNNVDDSGLVLMGGITRNIPSVFINKTDGEYLAGLSLENRKITVSPSFNIPYDKDYEMSDFSSWGVTPDLKLKPEITAPGGGIYSTILYGDSYGYKSGTSMASPNVAGLSALLLEYINKVTNSRGLTRTRRRTW